jgi:hypothetical protein
MLGRDPCPSGAQPPVVDGMAGLVQCDRNGPILASFSHLPCLIPSPHDSLITVRELGADKFKDCDHYPIGRFQELDYLLSHTFLFAT